MIETVQEFPKIGENIESFIKIFGKPASDSSGDLYLFEVEGITPRLHCSVKDSKVYNISWSLPYSVDKVRDVGLRFLPSEAYLVKEGVLEVNPMLNGDVPIKEDLYKIRGIEDDVFFGVGNDSTITIHLDIV